MHRRIQRRDLSKGDDGAADQAHCLHQGDFAGAFPRGPQQHVHHTEATVIRAKASSTPMMTVPTSPLTDQTTSQLYKPRLETTRDASRKRQRGQNTLRFRRRPLARGRPSFGCTVRAGTLLSRTWAPETVVARNRDGCRERARWPGSRLPG